MHPHATRHAVAAIDRSIPPAPVSGIVLHGRPAGTRPPFTPHPPSPPLRASQVRAVAAEELTWFFSCAATTETPALRARATIAGWLSTLTPQHVEVISLLHDPEPWPAALRSSRRSGFALVRRLASTRPTRVRNAEWAETRNLALAVERHGAGVLRGLERRAEQLFAEAVRAYARARGRSPRAVPS